MTDNNHPITPPPGLVQQWFAISCGSSASRWKDIVTQAARWGADQELEACITWMMQMGYWGEDGKAVPALRAARRPKPPSLKEQALETLLSMQIQPCVINGINTNADLMAKYDILRRALESLPD